MKRILVLMFLLVTSGMLFSQSSVYTSEPLKEYIPTVEKGTYQVVLANENIVVPEITPSLMNQIVSSRDQEDVVFIHLDKNTTIKVLPYKEIDAPNFVSPNKIKYEN